MKPILLTSLQSDTLGAGYISLKNSVDFFTQFYQEIKYNEALRQAASQPIANLTIVQHSLDKNLGCNRRFAREIQQSDTAGAFEILALYQRLNKPQKMHLELLLKAMSKGETIELVAKEDAY